MCCAGVAAARSLPVSSELGKRRFCNTFYLHVFKGSSWEFADDSNERGVLVLQPLVVRSEVPQNLQEHQQALDYIYHQIKRFTS